MNLYIHTYIYIYIYIYAIMKRMCPPGYHHKGFVATHALGHMMYTYIYQPKLIREFSKRFPELLKHDL